MSARTTADIVTNLHSIAVAFHIEGYHDDAAACEEGADRLEALELAALHACDTPDCPSWFWCTAHQTATSGAVKGPATCTLVGPYMTREEAEAFGGGS